ncbi:MAG: NAD(P)H-dependent glycerol-3-phosphate dehydrogenase [Methanobrevibacter sp.]|uniref:NAD(P)H-dependent glycerol-3-phosphate dehydrogenase n=1 Tax=Methanobrevibacter TaxID=2172 RepID=UPI0015BE2A7B|nr:MULTISPECIES: NAD(P)H-dependent glycerol-3-phosphate dehydrogenase [Methanobrevibacter]MBS7258313.1 NAD(P)H-dependent glycerol-3-phosphate dehydrogenase [Methanobrevibacter sp.]MCI7427646.1 NAD(P)H-dependent glycerol-3-phosphate dehydrogenase [Methanobrevibacter sp.]
MDLNVGVIGAGALGTAISQQISENISELILLLRNKELCDDINNLGYNTQYYPNSKLNDNIKATIDINDLSDCDIIFLAIPSSAFRKTLEDLKPIVKKDVIIVTTAKGIEYPSLKTMGKIIEEYFDDNYVALSGPNFASEIMLNLPTVTNIASKSYENSLKVKKVLTTKQFKVKIIDDICGIELCGILKNINAIANGICEGMNVNENARFGILTRGFKDTIMIIEAMGGKSETVHEYCGFGDLILTSTSHESRNHTLGILYGQRLIIDENASGIVFEGKNSIKAIKEICSNNNISSGTVNFVYDVIIKKITPTKAFNKLWENIE